MVWFGPMSANIGLSSPECARCRPTLATQLGHVLVGVNESCAVSTDVGPISGDFGLGTGNFGQCPPKLARCQPTEFVRVPMFPRCGAIFAAIVMQTPQVCQKCPVAPDVSAAFVALFRPPCERRPPSRRPRQWTDSSQLFVPPPGPMDGLFTENYVGWTDFRRTCRTDSLWFSGGRCRRKFSQQSY